MRQPCRKCLLSEIAPDTVYREVADYIASLDAAEKVKNEEYHRRLSECRICDALRDGMCALCGCFVEVRAVKKKNGCPALPPKWNKAE